MMSFLKVAALAAALQLPSPLPIVETPVSQPGHVMAILITGDGGWAAGDRGMAAGLAAHGIPVVGLDARAYFSPSRTPDETARDWERLARWYMNSWHRDSIVFVGYSRGADVAPFILNRVSPDVRSHVALVAMVGLADRASFEFHWQDILREVHRPSDKPTLPEVLKLRGMRLLCLYGVDEKGSLCPALPAGLAVSESHGGKHVVTGAEAPAIVQKIVAALR